MAEAYVIEVGGSTVGIVVRERRADLFSFHASKRTFGTLEKMTFASPREAERVARRHLNGRSGRRPGGAAARPAP